MADEEIGPSITYDETIPAIVTRDPSILGVRLQQEDMERYHEVYREKFSGIVSGIELSPQLMRDELDENEQLCAVSYGTKTAFLNCAERKKTDFIFSQFKSPLQSFRFRDDGKLVASAEESGSIKIFEWETRRQLRKFRVHNKATCRRVAFSNERTSLFSVDDLGGLILTDISTGKPIVSIESAHSASIRCLETGPPVSFLASRNLSDFASAKTTCLTGSYDGFVRLWDLRDGNKKAAAEFCHGAQSAKNSSSCVAVEALTVLCRDKLFATAASNIVSIWDGRKADAPITRITPHLKTITDVQVTGDLKQLFTVAADGTMKILALSAAKLGFSSGTTVNLELDESLMLLNSHRLEDKTGIPMKIGINERGTLIAVGTDTGYFFMRSNEEVSKSVSDESWLSREIALLYKEKKRRRSSNDDAAAIGIDTISQAEGLRKKFVPQKIDHKIARMLRHFEYQAAIERATQKGPVEFILLIEQLILNGGLEEGLRGKSEEELSRLFDFIAMHFSEEPQFNKAWLTAVYCLTKQHFDMISSTDDLGLINALKNLTARTDVENKINHKFAQLSVIL